MHEKFQVCIETSRRVIKFSVLPESTAPLVGSQGVDVGSVGANKGPIPFIIIYHISQKGLQQKSKDFEKKKFFVLRSDPKMFQACNKTMGSSTRVRTKTISEFINLLK